MKRFIACLFGIFICSICYAQTETINWYINGELYATTSCESGGNIDVPTPPENFGYNFAGWEPAIYDMSTLDTSINGNKISAGKNWIAKFSYGEIYGTSSCSPTSKPTNSNISNNIDTDTGTGANCWCKILSFIPTNSNKVYDSNVQYWTFFRTQTVEYCSSWCGDHCVTDLSSYSVFRSRLYGISQ